MLSLKNNFFFSFRLVLNLNIKRRAHYISIIKTEGEGEITDFGKWSQVGQELVKGIFEKAPGRLLITASTFTFKELNNMKQSFNSMIELKTPSTAYGKTYILPKEEWSSDDLHDIAASSQFETCGLWMQPCLTPGKMSEEEAEQFWKFAISLNAVDSNLDLIDQPDQVVGCLADGYEFVWTNPPPNKRTDQVMINIKQLCLKLEGKFEET